MRMSSGILPGPITPEEIERVKKLRDSGAIPHPSAALTPSPEGKATERMNSREIKAMYTIAGARLLLESPDMDGLTKRLRKLRLWWRFRGAVRTLRTCFDQAMDSCEKDQRKVMLLRAKHMIASVHENKREDPQGLTTWIYIRDLNLVVRYVLEDTCNMCILDETEAATCPLRKVLRGITTLSTLNASPGRNGCLFRGLTVMDEMEGDEL